MASLTWQSFLAFTVAHISTVAVKGVIRQRPGPVTTTSQGWNPGLDMGGNLNDYGSTETVSQRQRPPDRPHDLASWVMRRKESLAALCLIEPLEPWTTPHGLK